VALGRFSPDASRKIFQGSRDRIYGNRFPEPQFFPHPVLRPNRKHFRNGTPPPKTTHGQHCQWAEESCRREVHHGNAKVVNAIVREYGKPCEIRIELARELKKPRRSDWMRLHTIASASGE